jgi:hypothetical protein
MNLDLSVVGCAFWGVAGFGLVPWFSRELVF